MNQNGQTRATRRRGGTGAIIFEALGAIRVTTRAHVSQTNKAITPTSHFARSADVRPGTRFRANRPGEN
jgi:hypothetical protein